MNGAHRVVGGVHSTEASLPTLARPFLKHYSLDATSASETSSKAQITRPSTIRRLLVQKPSRTRLVVFVPTKAPRAVAHLPRSRLLHLRLHLRFPLLHQQFHLQLVASHRRLQLFHRHQLWSQYPRVQLPVAHRFQSIQLRQFSLLPHLYPRALSRRRSRASLSRQVAQAQAQQDWSVGLRLQLSFQLHQAQLLEGSAKLSTSTYEYEEVLSDGIQVFISLLRGIQQ